MKLRVKTSILMLIVKIDIDYYFRVMDADIKFNAVDGKNDRRSHHGVYDIDDEGSPV